LLWSSIALGLMLSPRKREDPGSIHRLGEILRASDTSLGSTVSFSCEEGYQIMGSFLITCHLVDGKPEWSTQVPYCEAIPKPEDRGFRVAVAMSVVSCIVILAMSLSFITSCVNHNKERRQQRKTQESASPTYYPPTYLPIPSVPLAPVCYTSPAPTTLPSVAGPSASQPLGSGTPSHSAIAASSLSSFKAGLKTFLFDRAFSSPLDSLPPPRSLPSLPSP
uniref:Sushi domain-containing protein n=1 Tax=Callorhinchus milii TaxID=7868 RepID=A0A4W3IQW8_CALMI